MRNPLIIAVLLTLTVWAGGTEAQSGPSSSADDPGPACSPLPPRNPDTPRPFTFASLDYLPLHSPQNGMDYELMVHRPGSYAQSGDRKYPVLYLLDPWWHMPLMISVQGSQVYDRTLPEFIIVGISYPGENPDFVAHRTRDYSTTVVEEVNGETGGATRFLSFIGETLIPFVESCYRADPDSRALAGQSLGGLFTLWTMYQQTGWFDRYLASSPAVLWDENHLFGVDEAFASRDASLDARLFVSYGTAEVAAFAEPISQFQALLEKRNYAGLQLRNHVIEGDRHGSTVFEAYNRGMRWIFSDLAPGGPSGLEQLMNQQPAEETGEPGDQK